MHDDLEHLVERSLDERAGRLAPGHGSLDDVLVRVDRRHQRRRATAVVGSLAVAAVGLVGLSVVQGADEPLSRSDGLDAAFATTGPMRVLEGTLDAWRCEGVIDVVLPAGDMSHYYAGCTPVTIIDGVPVDVVPTTTTTVMEVPATWVECQPGDGADYDVTLASTTPCGTVPHTTVAYCEQVDGGVTVTVPCVTSPPLPVDSTTPLEDVVDHILGPGDTPFRIAEAYGLTLDELAAANRTNPA